MTIENTALLLYKPWIQRNQFFWCQQKKIENYRRRKQRKMKWEWNDRRLLYEAYKIFHLLYKKYNWTNHNSTITSSGNLFYFAYLFLLLLKFEDTFFLCIDDYGHEHSRYIYVHCKYIPREQKIDIFIYLFIFWIFLFQPWTTSKIYFHYVKIAEANVIQPNFIGSLANKNVCCACYTYVYGIHMRCRMKCYKRNGIVLVHAVERSHIKMWIEIQGMKCV